MKHHRCSRKKVLEKQQMGQLFSFSTWEWSNNVLFVLNVELHSHLHQPQPTTPDSQGKVLTDKSRRKKFSDGRLSDYHRQASADLSARLTRLS